MSMSPLDDSGDEILDKLRERPDPTLQVERARAAAEHNEKIRKRFTQLVEENSSRPVTISSIRVLGAGKTRKGFLDPIFSPLFSANSDQPYTLLEVLEQVTTCAAKLSRFGIYREPVPVFIDKADPTNPSNTPTDVDVYVRASELPRIRAKTGTEIGNVEGAAYGNVQFRNLFGGAESLSLNASYGTRTRNAYLATFETPILSNPDLTLSVGGLKSAHLKPWASHEEVLRGTTAQLRWATPYVHNGIHSRDPRISSTHNLSYTGAWRQITGLAMTASPTVRFEAGDSTKSSLTHMWISDTRDHPYLPANGRLLKTVNEIAGVGPLGGDVGFLKSEFEASAGIPIPNPLAAKNSTGISGFSLTTGFRTGVLYPLPVGFGGQANPSRINDRFQLGGPTDVRGFRQGGIGPRDGADSLGGDVYAAGSINLLTPFPRVSPETPLRLQMFLNGGRLVSLSGKNGKWDGSNVLGAVQGGVREVFLGGAPSLAAGVGIVYAHPAARFELNFSLPLVVRRGEEARKGLQFGVGLSFL